MNTLVTSALPAPEGIVVPMAPRLAPGAVHTPAEKAVSEMTKMNADAVDAVMTNYGQAVDVDRVMAGGIDDLFGSSDDGKIAFQTQKGATVPIGSGVLAVKNNGGSLGVLQSMDRQAA